MVPNLRFQVLNHGFSFCLGDAVHRHPPFNGLGSNTCIQDAFNLAWKIAYTEHHSAGSSLLSTYDSERQPVGYGVVHRANTAFREHLAVWENLGQIDVSKKERSSIFRELSEHSKQGMLRRKAFQQAIQHTSHEYHALGIEMGQLYSSSAIYGNEEPTPYKPTGRASEDPVLYYEPNTYPGKRVPHAWLNRSLPETPVSTIDLTGHGSFVILTGFGGEAWKQASLIVEKELGITIKAFSIGFRQDFEDVYFDWEELRGVSESGAILVRPDRYVAWRSHAVLDSVSECVQKLNVVMSEILGLVMDQHLSR